MAPLGLQAVDRSRRSAAHRAARPRPPLKWAGGKARLLPQLRPLFPSGFDLYVEPFVGGGAVFFYLRPARAVLIDRNDELVNFYLVLRDRPDELVEDLRKHRATAEYYYAIRALRPEALSPVERASRFLYLNKTAYNGLWRVNGRGEFNVPFGRYRNPRIVDEPNLRAASRALASAEILRDDFSRALDFARPGTFLYLDPPYHPLSATSSFTAYTRDAFRPEDHRRLAEVFRELDRRGCLVMLSNSDTPVVRDLYRGYDVRVVHAPRAINSRPDRRGPVPELVIRNYGAAS